jgi:hypothetical protein
MDETRRATQGWTGQRWGLVALATVLTIASAVGGGLLLFRGEDCSGAEYEAYVERLSERGAQASCQDYKVFLGSGGTVPPSAPEELATPAAPSGEAEPAPEEVLDESDADFDGFDVDLGRPAWIFDEQVTGSWSGLVRSLRMVVYEPSARADTPCTTPPNGGRTNLPVTIEWSSAYDDRAVPGETFFAQVDPESLDFAVFMSSDDLAEECTIQPSVLDTAAGSTGDFRFAGAMNGVSEGIASRVGANWLVVMGNDQFEITLRRVN